MPPTADMRAAARLPGIRFQAVPPAPAEVLPRMDIAGFVGFAASGPIGVPVAVEDATQFAAVFGSDVPIAWDPSHNEPAYALLGPAVRGFFRNGGRRCWVVRVADRARAERDEFELPGVAAVGVDGTIGFAVFRASSCGSWADGVSVTSVLESTPVALDRFSAASMSFTAALPTESTLARGDLVRLRFPAAAATLYATVGSLTAASSVAPGVPRGDVVLDRRLWVWPVSPPRDSSIAVSYLGPDGIRQAAVGTVTAASPTDGLTRLAFAPALSGAPAPGALVLGALGAQDVLLEVSETEASAVGISAIAGTALLAGVAPPELVVGSPEDVGERLRLSLTAADAGPAHGSVLGLGFAPEAARFLGALPTDEELYAPDTGDAPPAQPSFPLSGPAAPPAWYVPLAATVSSSPRLGALFSATPALERDGLSTFGSALFIDPALRSEPVATLLETAAWVRDQSPDPRPLEGMHALLGNDEVTLLALPDAVHRGWLPAPVTAAEPPAPPAAVSQPDWSRFLPCGTRVLRAPQFPLPAEASPPAGETTGVIHLSWTATDAPGAVYKLQEARDPDFADAADIYLGSERAFDLSRPPAGSRLYLRVRALAGGMESPWSPGALIEVPGERRWLLIDPVPEGATAGYSPEPLLEVQIAALRMCAARGDLLAVLALPEHYRAADALSHLRTLKARGNGAPSAGANPPFGFGALYHPWLYCADPNHPTMFRRTPPDGAAVGLAAVRAANRGAWVNPANEPLTDVLALDAPVAPDDYQALADARVNFVRDDPDGFLWLSADTLSDDPQAGSIGVRRLLALLRRTAERYGNAHVFEPNGDISRRTARRSFEALLSHMFSAGAFAGRTAAEAFAVATPATPTDLDAGRLIVELLVAPSQPLAFLTIRLVQSSDGTVQVTTR